MPVSPPATRPRVGAPATNWNNSWVRPEVSRQSPPSRSSNGPVTGRISKRAPSPVEGTEYWSSVSLAVGAVGADRGEAVGEVADLDIGERRKGQAVRGRPACSEASAPRVPIVAERGAALAFVGEGGEIGLKLDRAGKRRDRARGEARLAVGRGAVRGPALARDDGDEAVAARIGRRDADEAVRRDARHSRRRRRRCRGCRRRRRRTAPSRSRGEALSSSIVPASAPGPLAPLPPPRTTRIRPSRRGSKAGQAIQPPNGSVCGTPSSISSARLEALPPSARRVAPWLVGLAVRASERRNCWKPGTSRSTSSSRSDAE